MEPGKQKSRIAEFLAEVEASKALLWLLPGVRERSYGSPGFSAEATSISVSAVPYCGLKHFKKKSSAGCQLVEGLRFLQQYSEI